MCTSITSLDGIKLYIYDTYDYKQQSLPEQRRFVTYFTQGKAYEERFHI